MTLRGWTDHLWQDIRYGVRSLRNKPAFVAVVVVTLALGIGANTTIFSIVNGVLLKPLPFSEPHRLYLVFEKTAATPRASVPYPNFLDWQRTTHSFSSLAAFRKDNMILTGEGRPERLHAAMISAGLLSTLGIKLVAGREFRANEDLLGGPSVLMISESFWRQRLASADVLGKSLRLDGLAYTIVGIVPRSLETIKIPLFAPGDVYIPVGQWREPSFRDRKVTTGLCVVGRLRSDATESSAAADMSKLAADLAAAYPDANRTIGITLIPLQKLIVAGVEQMLLLLFFAVTFVLLITCTNVASLLLVRSTGRMREFATRTALGASPHRLMIQLLTESLLLALLGGATGVALAIGATRLAVRLLSGEFPQPNSLAIDSHVLLFAFIVSLVAGIFVGLVPAFKISGLPLSETLKQGGRGLSSSKYRAQRIFVVAEVGLALILVVGAALMVQSLVGLWRAHPGFDPHNLLVFDITPSPEIASDAQKIRVLFHHLTDRLEAIPGVDSASMILDPLPLAGVADVVAFDVAGRSVPTNPKDKTSAIWYFVGPDYFRTMSIALKRGRAFQLTDDENSPQVAIIDEAFALSMFPNEDPIGKRIVINYTGTSQIIGVVSHVNHWNLGGDAANLATRQMYFPYSQLADKYLPLGIKGGATVLVRTQSQPLGLLSAIQEQTAQLDNGLATFDVHTMDAAVEIWLSTRRLAMILLSIFGFLALLLAAVGIYGVISYIVGQRTQEIGIRLTLGARPRDVSWLVMAQGGKLALLGVGLGILAALSLTRLMAGLLYGVKATAPLTLVAAAFLLMIVALGACYFPARRAMNLDALVSLRAE
jgi:predicted permease